jgi:hypothetical protein
MNFRTPRIIVCIRSVIKFADKNSTFYIQIYSLMDALDPEPTMGISFVHYTAGDVTLHAVMLLMLHAVMR